MNIRKMSTIVVRSSPASRDEERTFHAIYKGCDITIPGPREILYSKRKHLGAVEVAWDPHGIYPEGFWTDALSPEDAADFQELARACLLTDLEIGHSVTFNVCDPATHCGVCDRERARFVEIPRLGLVCSRCVNNTDITIPADAHEFGVHIPALGYCGIFTFEQCKTTPLKRMGDQLWFVGEHFYISRFPRRGIEGRYRLRITENVRAHFDGGGPPFESEFFAEVPRNLRPPPPPPPAPTIRGKHAKKSADAPSSSSANQPSSRQ